MLSDELLQEIRTLEDVDKQELFWMLLKDPALNEISPEVTGLRYNYEAAGKLLEYREDLKAETTPELK